MQKKLQTILSSAMIFFAITAPFRELFRVMEVTEMRPASALPPVFGLMLGIPGAIGCAFGNLFADILSGYSPLLCGMGLLAQFIYGALPLLIWRYIRNRNAGEPELLRLNNVKNVLRYIGIVFINAIVMALLLGALMQSQHISNLLSLATLMLFLNNFVFCMVLGIPILIFMSTRKSPDCGGGLSLNERFILFFLLLGVVSAGLCGVFAYAELKNILTDPLMLWNRIYLYITITLLVFYVITIIFLRYSEKSITIPVESIARIVSGYIRLGKEKRDSRAVAQECEAFISTKNEVGVLAGAFRSMILDIDAYIENLTTITAEKERIGTELSVATKIQAGMLPCIFPAFPKRSEFDIFASMTPAREVGGDFYDFFLVDDKTLAVVMADVSGKGVPSALFMVVTKTLLKNNAQLGKSPKEVMEAVNNILCENNEACMFVTALFGYLNIPSGKFTYVNAGHNHPLLFRGGQPSWLKEKPDFVLAGMEDISYTQHEITLRPGDELFLYTDGVTEAMNNQQELFGDERLFQVACRFADLAPNQLIQAVQGELDAFADGAEQADDITMLALVYENAGETDMSELFIEAKLENMDAVLDFVSKRLKDQPDLLQSQISVAVDEIFSNIARYAYNPSVGNVLVRVAVGEDITLEFEDSGAAFDPLTMDDPDITLAAEDREIGGLGMYIVKDMMDAVEYRRKANKNILTIKKKLG